MGDIFLITYMYKIEKKYLATLICGLVKFKNV